MIYLDNAATTKPSEAAAAAAEEMIKYNYFNPSSRHSGGIAAEKALAHARFQVASAMGAAPEEIYFTSGGTEGDNTVLFSAFSAKTRHVIIGATEHDAVLAPAKRLSELGITVDYVKPDSCGRITADAISALLRDDTGLVSVMHVNNETGIIQDISGISRMLRSSGSKALLHTDAVQSFLKTESKITSLGADIAAVSAHKIHGIKGAGALYLRKGVHLKPFILGGGQERNFRSGTEALPAIAAFGAAAEEGSRFCVERMSGVSHVSAFLKDLLSSVPGVCIREYGAPTSPYIINISVPGLKSEVMLNSLSSEGIYVSAGAACAKGKISHVLSSMGTDRVLADSFIRISLSHETSETDAVLFTQVLGQTITKLKR